ncbi:hypothetical protein Godav_001532 [Gossypium davidsonii]|uniref:Homeobox domain-containing protein n=1 Tax=Gossypium davidsonii TaxID=34287 RepID=A0A7J8T495_GOSDV|nr:hypothetical protein [Gossypium davidsonii]
MEDHGPDPNSPSHVSERSEPVRSRWTPKPEQILILESIFNSGMVNPSKDETVRIRKLLEKFGSVGDANVFYWFQNRRSRSRRRQRQLQASLAAGSEQRNNNPQAQAVYGGGAIQYDSSVFINGVPTEVPRGPLDVKAMFGEDVDLVHSSGVPIPINEFGFLLQTLQHGESYFLVTPFTSLFLY